LPDGRTIPAVLAGRDASTDLAVFKIEGAGVDVAEIGNAATLKVGHMVLAIGRLGERGPSASLGVISALGGAWRTWRGGLIDQLIRPDLTLYPGFSGGPLVYAQGRVAGINTSGLSRRVGLTIPASTVDRVTNALLEKGRIARGYLGLGMQPVRLPGAIRSALKLPTEGGVIVLTVEPNGPADKAGIMIGDILVAFDGTPIRDTDDVQAVLGPERVGQTVRTSVIRGGALTELTITVGERP
jgi:S1-C subfamily serine protease